jgi:hypothetical protein
VQDGCDTNAHKSRRNRPAHDLAYELARPQQVSHGMKVTHPLAAFSHAEEAIIVMETNAYFWKYNRQIVC